MFVVEITLECKHMNVIMKLITKSDNEVSEDVCERNIHIISFLCAHYNSGSLPVGV